MSRSLGDAKESLLEPEIFHPNNNNATNGNQGLPSCRSVPLTILRCSRVSRLAFVCLFQRKVSLLSLKELRKSHPVQQYDLPILLAVMIIPRVGGFASGTKLASKLRGEYQCRCAAEAIMQHSSFFGNSLQSKFRDLPPLAARKGFQISALQEGTRSCTSSRKSFVGSRKSSKRNPVFLTINVCRISH